VALLASTGFFHGTTLLCLTLPCLFSTLQGYIGIYYTLPTMALFIQRFSVFLSNVQAASTESTYVKSDLTLFTKACLCNNLING